MLIESPMQDKTNDRLSKNGVSTHYTETMISICAHQRQNVKEKIWDLRDQNYGMNHLSIM